MNVSKILTWIHRIMFLVSMLILAGSLAFYLIKWNSFPDEIGIHFAPDGQFDVIASKWYGFYPHVIGSLMIAGAAAAGSLAGRIKIGLRISSEGEKLFKEELRLTLDSISMVVSLFFASWSRSVSLQLPLDVSFVRILFWILQAVIAAILIAAVVTYRKHKN